MPLFVIGSTPGDVTEKSETGSASKRMVTLGRHPREVTRDVVNLIRAGRFDEIDPILFKTLASELSRQAVENFDLPLEALIRLSGDQARGSLAEIFVALATPRPGRPHSRADWVEGNILPLVDRSPFPRRFKTMAEFHESLALDYAAARREAARRDDGTSPADLFRVSLTPLLAEVAPEDHAEFVNLATRAALRVLRKAPSGARRAIRGAVGLSSRSKRRKHKELVLELKKTHK